MCLSFAVLPPHLPRGDHRGDRNPDPSVGEHRRMVPVGTTGRAALDAVCILLTHRAQNNVTFVPCGTAYAEQFCDPLSLIPVIPFYAEIQGMRETIETPARDRISL